MNSTANKLRSVFLVGFLLTIALALTGYIDSSFVGEYVSVKTVGILFSVGSIVSIAFLAYLPKLLRKIGVRGAFQLAAFAYLLSILGMIYTESSVFFQLCFIVYIAAGIGLYFTIDMLVEHFSKRESTGSTRGVYLAVYNLAFLVGPLLAGTLLVNNSFELVYFTAGIFIIVMFLLFVKDLESVDFATKHRGISFIKNVGRFWKNKDIRNVYLVSLSLSFFFSWMAIYMPIHLNRFIGFDWQAIGAIFAIMHIPYVTLEVPLGRLADRCRCEREIISVGLLILAFSTIIIGNIESTSFGIWALALTLTRVGASFIQVGSESFFFRKVQNDDADTVAFFRNASPVAYILGPLVATLVLTMTDYPGLFVVLGCVMLSVLAVSSKLSEQK